MAQRFYSTNSPGEFVDLKEAVLRSLPADNGLYMPETIPAVGSDFWREWRDWSFAELGYRIVSPLFGGAVPEDTLREMVTLRWWRSVRRCMCLSSSTDPRSPSRTLEPASWHG